MNHERKTIAAMIRLHCRRRHGGRPFCEPCRELLAYADSRLAACRYGDDKPTCRQCPTHCYRNDMRDKITEVMRYAGPRMMLYHPVIALRHLLRERKGSSG